MSNIPYAERVHRKLTSDLPALPPVQINGASMPAPTFFNLLFAVSNWSALLRQQHDSLDAPYNDAQAKFINAYADMLSVLDELYDLDRQLMFSAMPDATKEKIKSALADARLKVRRGEGREKRTRGQYMLTDAVRLVRNAQVCLNPMALRPTEFFKHAKRDTIDEYRIASTGLIANIRSTVRKRLDLFLPDGELAAANTGTTASDPIDPETGLKFYQTLEAYNLPSRDPRTPAWTTDPFYKYHAMVWGRRKYASLLRELNFNLCPFFLLPLEDFEGRGANPNYAQEAGDYAYLELAELDYFDVLDGIGGLNPNPSISIETVRNSCVRLPFYWLYGGHEDAAKRIEEKTAPFVIDAAHIASHLHFDEWRQPRLLGTSRARLGLQICKEKERLGLITSTQLEYVKASTHDKDGKEVYQCIRDYSCIDYAQWRRRAEIIEALNT